MSASFEVSLGIALYSESTRVEMGGSVRSDFAICEFTPNLDFINVIKQFNHEDDDSAEAFFRISGQLTPELSIEANIFDLVSNSYPDGDEGAQELMRISDGLVDGKVSLVCDELGISKKDFYSVIFEYNNDYEIGRVQVGMWLDAIPEDLEPDELKDQIPDMYFPAIDIDALLSFNMNADPDVVTARIQEFCVNEFSDNASQLIGVILKELEDYLF